MARNERQEEGTPGGVGTITRTGDRRAPARDPRQPDPRQGGPRPAAPWRVPPAQRSAGTRPEQPQQATRPPQAATSTRQRPQPQAQPQAQPQVQPQAQPQVQPQPQPRPRALGLPAVAGPHRMPFVLLLCGLLGGALVSALVISTTLAAGSFEITKLQNSTSSLARQRQALQDQVALAQSAPVIATKAAELGMREVNELRFLDLKTGKITTDAGSPSNAPKYMP